MNTRHLRLQPTQRVLIIAVIALEVVGLVVYAALSRLSSDNPTSGPALTSSIAAAGTGCQAQAYTANVIAAENACPGTASWRQNLPFGAADAIEAYTAPASVNLGETIQLFVSTTAPSYTFRVYRMGWYQGLGARLVYSSDRLQGIQQPQPVVDPATRMASASNWHDPTRLAVPRTWVSGVYLVKLLSSAGFIRYTTFVVRDDASHAQILVQSSVTTDQAYNTWGGRSLYESQTAPGNAAERAYAVSFDRPYAENGGMSYFPTYEYNILRWLEQRGYDVTYTTDVDTDLRGSLLLNHRLFLALGHDEYWSSGMRANVTQARDKGISLAFFGSNDAYWHIRFQPSALGPDRVVVCYRTTALDPMASSDPSTATVRWRDPPVNQPEQVLLGAMFNGIPTEPAPLVLAPGAARFLEHTGLHTGTSLPGLVGAYLHSTGTGEVDSVTAGIRGTPASLTILASSPVHIAPGSMGSNGDPTVTTVYAASTLYTASSGARVFDAGTRWWGLGLDDMRIGGVIPSGAYSSPGFQQFTANLLAYLLHQGGS